jgi:hypothetical protein
MGAGAPDKYDFELCIEICERVSLGENIKAILESDRAKFPSFPTFCKWKRENEELFNLYVNCHQDKAVALENEMDMYRDMLLKGEIDASTYNTLVQTLKWKMAKFYPKVFGEKQSIDHTTQGEKIQQPVWKVIDGEK